MSLVGLKSFAIPVKILKCFGLWQTRISSWKYCIFGASMHFFFIDLLMILQLGYLGELKNLKDFSDVTNLLIMMLLVLLRSIIFIQKVGDIEELFKLVKETFDDGFVNYDETKRLQNIVKLFKFYWGSSFATIIIAAFTPFLTHELPQKLWFPYDYKSNEFLFWISAVYQTMASTIQGIEITLNVFPLIFICYIIEMMEQLCKRLENIKKKNPKQKNVNVGQKTTTLKENEKLDTFLDCI